MRCTYLECGCSCQHKDDSKFPKINYLGADVPPETFVQEVKNRPNHNVFGKCHSLASNLQS